MSKMINIIGKKFGKLTVMCLETSNRHGVCWKCQCDCGNIKVCCCSSLRSGKIKSCGCILAKNLIGKKFGRLLVIKRIFNIEHKNKNVIWSCLCDCGCKKNVSSKCLINGNTQSCGCLYKEKLLERTLPSGIASFNALINDYLQCAKKRDILFELSPEECNNLFKGICFYCGLEPESIKKTASNTGDYIYNGIDRINSKIGYTIENSVSCCKRCNYAKREMSLEEFKNWINRIKNHTFTI